MEGVMTLSGMRLRLAGCLAVLFASEWLGQFGAAAETANYDCGPLGLYSLLRLEGRPTDLRDIKRHLPSPPPGGHSMRDLRVAAHARGLCLTGVLLEKVDKAIDRPMLVLMKRGAHGHFQVIRPIGHTGNLVQVIDSTRPLEVMDKSDLLMSPGWTGLALVPSRPNWSFLIAGGGVIVAGLVCFARRVFPRPRALRPGPERVSSSEVARSS